jgi:hypothetical protein
MSSPQPTREELYEKVWRTPMAKLAEEFGVSDVALAKRCRNQDIPVPPRGYWAKLAAGKTPSKAPLPPAPPEFKADDTPPTASTVEFPNDCSSLQPIARELRAALRSAATGEDKRVKVGNQSLPSVEVTKALIDSACRAFNYILMALEARGIEFCRARSKYDQAYFSVGNVQLRLAIEEPILTKHREPTEAEKRRPSWEWKTHTREPANRLHFQIVTDDRYSGYRSRSEVIEEDGLTPLAEAAKATADAIWRHYVELEKKRAAEQEERKRQEEVERIRQIEEKKLQHASTLAAIARQRAENLPRAAEWWRLHCQTSEFIDECERRWRAAQPELSPEQLAWLSWAREIADGLSPFALGYPDPLSDGAFEAAAVVQGGPYPPRRDIPRPPTTPKIPAPIVQQPSYGQPHPAPKQYPFWLKYPRH